MTGGQFSDLPLPSQACLSGSALTGFAAILAMVSADTLRPRPGVAVSEQQPVIEIGLVALNIGLLLTAMYLDTE